MARGEFEERSGRAAGPETEGPEPQVNDRVRDANAGAEPPPETVEELRAAVERYKAEAERNWAQFLHAAADLENYKKQAARAREDAVQRARRSLLTVVLSV